MLLEVPTVCDEQARHIDVLCFTKSDADRALHLVDRRADESEPNTAVPSVLSEAGVENEEDDANSNVASKVSEAGVDITKELW